MAFEFKLPEIGEGVTQGEIVKWLVKVGDAIGEDQPIVEIMTDKATVEIASPKAGQIEKLLAKEGDTIDVGSGLAQIKEGKNDATTQANGSHGNTKTDVKNTDKSPDRHEAKSKSMPEEKSSAMQDSLKHSSTAPQTSLSRDENQSILASPATRKFARENDISLATIQGSGPQGRVLMEDVVAFSKNPVQEVSSTAKRQIPNHGSLSPSGREERIPIRGIRKKIAENMARSKQKAAHFTHVDQVDMTELVNLRASLKQQADEYGVKLTYLPFIVKAVCLALQDYPKLNSSYDEENQELVVKYDYNIGIAVATKDDDLIVPVIHQAHQRSILEISSEISELAEKARTNKLSPSNLQGGTFTITSMGNIGGLMATPIINYPEVGILGFHEIRETPVVRNGEIVIRHIAHASVSLDHRMVDGLLGARFLKSMISYLEQPGSMLLYA